MDIVFLVVGIETVGPPCLLLRLRPFSDSIGVIWILLPSTSYPGDLRLLHLHLPLLLPLLFLLLLLLLSIGVLLLPSMLPPPP